jgi:hypothetical protein
MPVGLAVQIKRPWWLTFAAGGDLLAALVARSDAAARLFDPEVRRIIMYSYTHSWACRADKDGCWWALDSAFASPHLIANSDEQLLAGRRFTEAGQSGHGNAGVLFIARGSWALRNWLFDPDEFAPDIRDRIRRITTRLQILAGHGLDAPEPDWPQPTPADQTSTPHSSLPITEAPAEQPTAVQPVVRSFPSFRTKVIRFVSLHQPAQARPKDPSRKDQGGAYEDQGGAYEDQGGAYEDQGGAYEDQGGAYEDQGGAYEDQGGAYEDQGDAEETSCLSCTHAERKENGDRYTQELTFHPAGRGESGMISVPAPRTKSLFGVTHVESGPVMVTPGFRIPRPMPPTRVHKPPIVLRGTGDEIIRQLRAAGELDDLVKKERMSQYPVASRPQDSFTSHQIRAAQALQQSRDLSRRSARFPGRNLEYASQGSRDTHDIPPQPYTRPQAAPQAAPQACGSGFGTEPPASSPASASMLNDPYQRRARMQKVASYLPPDVVRTIAPGSSLAPPKTPRGRR